MKITLALIVKPTNKEADLLDRCLNSAYKYFDEINITITGRNKKCENVCIKYGAKVTFFDWVDDFAKARNFNFSHASGEYIMWLDCDDILKGGEFIREAVAEMNKNNIDTVILPYLYDFDSHGLCTVRHNKTRIIKNDGCVKWVGVVHEDFHSNREIRQYLDEKIQVLHLKDEAGAKESSKRNIRIAKSEFKKNIKDPRNHYLMANAYLAQHKNKSAKKFLLSFVNLSQSKEEKYLAFIYLADIEDNEKLKYLSKAWELRPAYPNTYFKMGEMLYKNGNYKTAKNFLELGLQMPKPDDSIIVFNPREYDYVPLMLMSSICYELGEYQQAIATLDVVQKLYPKDDEIKKSKDFFKRELGEILKADKYLNELEKIKDKNYLKKKLDSLPDNIKAHPKICFFRNNNFIKETTTGKDIVFYCSYTSKTWTPKNVINGGVGGSEESVINIAKYLKLKGWNVTVYNNCGVGGVFDGVIYRPWWAYNVKDKQDITVLWRHPKTVDYLDERAGRIFIDMHDVIQDGEFTPARLEKIEKVFLKTKAHRALFPSIPEEKVAIIPNGFDSDMFVCKQTEKNPYLLLNTSSPDRHIDATLDIFEKLLEKEPHKPWKLAWYYGWDVYKEVHKGDSIMTDWMTKQVDRFNKLILRGRAEGGYMISHVDIANKYCEAGVFIYPTQFFEIHCISAVKAQVGGCRVITSDFGALDEVVTNGIKIHTDGKKWGTENTFGDTYNVQKYVEAILDNRRAQITIKSTYKDWNAVTDEWNNYLQ